MKEAEKVRMINAVIIPRLFSNDKFKERLIESVLSSVFYPLRGIGIEVPFEFPNFIFISGIVDEIIMKYSPNLKKDDYREAPQAGRPSPRIFKRVRTEVKLKSLLEYLISLHVNELPKEL